MAKNPRRIVRIVKEQPDRRGSKAPLFAYGYGAVAKMAGVSVFTIKRHEKLRFINMQSLYSVLRYLQRAEQANNPIQWPGQRASDSDKGL